MKSISVSRKIIPLQKNWYIIFFTCKKIWSIQLMTFLQSQSKNKRFIYSGYMYIYTNSGKCIKK